MDFVCLDRNLILELDGGQHQSQIRYDAVRTKWLESQGFKVIRFWNNQIQEQLESVKEEILVALEG